MRHTWTSMVGKTWLFAVAASVCGVWCTAGMAQQAAADVSADAAAPGIGQVQAGADLDGTGAAAGADIGPGNVRAGADISDGAPDVGLDARGEAGGQLGVDADTTVSPGRDQAIEGLDSGRREAFYRAEEGAAGGVAPADDPRGGGAWQSEGAAQKSGGAMQKAGGAAQKGGAWQNGGATQKGGAWQKGGYTPTYFTAARGGHHHRGGLFQHRRAARGHHCR